jgi:hypothetical protein
LSVLLDAHAADAGVNASPHVPLVLLSAVCCCCVLLYTASAEGSACGWCDRTPEEGAQLLKCGQCRAAWYCRWAGVICFRVEGKNCTSVKQTQQQC